MLFPTPRKVTKVFKPVKGHNQPLTIRSIASIIGKTVSSFPGAQYDPLYYRGIEELLNYGGNLITLMQSAIYLMLYCMICLII